MADSTWLEDTSDGTQTIYDRSQPRQKRFSSTCTGSRVSTPIRDSSFATSAEKMLSGGPTDYGRAIRYRLESGWPSPWMLASSVAGLAMHHLGTTSVGSTSWRLPRKQTRTGMGNSLRPTTSSADPSTVAQVMLISQRRKSIRGRMFAGSRSIRCRSPLRLRASQDKLLGTSPHVGGRAYAHSQRYRHHGRVWTCQATPQDLSRLHHHDARALSEVDHSCWELRHPHAAAWVV